jgi:hypothetical protein
MSQKISFRQVVLGASLVAGCSLALVASHGVANRRAASSRLRVPEVIGLGPTENGSIHRVPITIATGGGSPTVLTNFRGSCSCMQVYEVVAGAKREVTELHLPPVGSKTIYADIRVSGNPGENQAVAVEFEELGRAASPYQVFITFTPTAHLYTIPKMVSLGEMPVNSSKIVRPELRSDGTFRQPLDSLSVSRSGLFTASLIPVDEPYRRHFAATHTGQHLVGLIDLRITPGERARHIADELLIRNGRQEACRVPISGTAVADIECSPSVLVLPRLASGTIDYSARVFFRSRSRKSLSVELAAQHEGFEVDIQADRDEHTAMATVRYIGDRPAKPRKEQLQFKVAAAGGDPLLSLPVTILPRSVEVSTGRGVRERHIDSNTTD